jgi:phage shock protein A
VAGKAELAASRLDVQFEALEDEKTNAEVEARLAELTGGSTAALGGGRIEDELNRVAERR